MKTEIGLEKRRVQLEPDGLSVKVGSRVAYLFQNQSERTRFTSFIANGLAARDKCVIVTDETGRNLFCDALRGLGVDAAKAESNGELVILTDEVSVESIEPVALPILKDAQARFRGSRCINDSTWMQERGWTDRDFMRFEVKGHLLTQHQPCTIICQYDISVIARRRLQQVIAAHQYTVLADSAGGKRVEINPDSRPLGQVIFDGMDEQLRALTRLQDLSLTLSATLTLDETLDAIIDAAMTICRADYAAISSMDESGQLELVRHRGLSDEYISQRKLTRFEPSVAGMLSDHRPVIIEDVEQMARTSPNYTAWKNEGIRSIVSLPLISEGDMFGVIGAGSREARFYSQTEIDAMAILSAQAGAAIINARLFEQLKEANRAKDEFLATLSHELRTPLTPILGWMHILKPFGEQDELLAQGLEVIERNASQQASLINDLLDLTRIVSGKIKLALEPTDIGSLVQSAVEQMRPQASARQLEIDASLPDRCIVLNLDTARIQQVVANLLQNAIKFTPEGGHIRVSLAREHSRSGSPDSVVIEVSDDGIGIDPKFLPHIFERFSQAHGGINRCYGGLGLGLAIIRSVVEMHEGQVTASSPGPGLGSSFKVRLPLAVDHTSGSRKKTAKSDMDDTNSEHLGLRVLVVEDSRDTLDMLQLWLELFECDALVATDAMEGLKIAREQRPDLIISDIGMPGMDGYDFIQQLRKTEGLEHTPAIALTGYAQKQDRDLALLAGYNAHLAKPARMSALLSLIKELSKKYAPPS
jgi:signal transduction histidine kinase/ActR/RegA family two-component response regulator